MKLTRSVSGKEGGPDATDGRADRCAVPCSRYAAIGRSSE